MKKPLFFIFVLFLTVLIAQKPLKADAKEDFENLQRFVQWGDVEEVKGAIKKSKAAVNYNNGAIILDAVNLYNDPTILKMLLDAGANPNFLQENTNNNALHILLESCTSDNAANILEGIKLLIAKNIDVNHARNNDAFTPLHVAAKNEYVGPDIISALLAAKNIDVNKFCNPINEFEGGAWPPLCFAATRRNDDNGTNKDIVKLLIDKKADFKFTSPDVHPLTKRKWTLLHFACETLGDHLEVVKIIVEAGADIEAVATNDGFTPLHTAMMNNNPNICQYLLEKGANYMSKNVDGVTILDHSLAFGRGRNFESAEVIIKWAETHK